MLDAGYWMLDSGGWLLFAGIVNYEFDLLILGDFLFSCFYYDNLALIFSIFRSFLILASIYGVQLHFNTMSRKHQKAWGVVFAYLHAQSSPVY
jgi:hypothetical protein